VPEFPFSIPSAGEHFEIKPTSARSDRKVFPRERQKLGALRAFHEVEIEKWWPIIKANIKVE
jgi:hypothetical protein